MEAIKKKEQEKEDKEWQKEERKRNREEKKKEKEQAKKGGDKRDDEEDRMEIDDLNDEDNFEVDETDSEDEEDEEVEEIGLMSDCWKKLCPPVEEADIWGKWFACIYLGKKGQLLYIGRVKRRFLMGEGGMPCGLELDCLVRKIGVGHYILKEGNPDIETFPLKNIIAGPVKMMPLKGKRWL